MPFAFELSDEFRPFVANHVIPDCRAEFLEKAQLEENLGSIVTDKTAFQVRENPDGTWLRCYRGADGGERILIHSHTQENGHILVEFLPQAREYMETTQQLFFYIAMEEQLLRHGRWIVHASCVKTPLGAILFVGPSGMGKTTQADLWEKYRGSKVLNGDRTIIYQKDGVWYAAGSPYAGSSKRYVNESAPISLVVLLEQGTDNRVQALTPGQAFRNLYPHLTVNDWNPRYVETITDQLDQFVRERPVVHFSCTPDEKAVDALWEELTKEVDHG